MRRRWLFAALAAGAGVLGLALAALLYTPAGLHWALARVQAGSEGAFSVASEEGRLAGPFTLKEVRIRTGRLELEIPSVHLDWRPGALLIGRVHVLDLALADLKLTIPDAGGTGDAKVPGALTLPLDLSVDQLTLSDSRIRLGKGSAFSITRLELAAHTSALRLALDRLDAAGPGYEVHAHGALGTLGAHKLELDTRYQLHPVGLAAIVGRLSARGDLTGIELGQRLSAPTALTLQARVDTPLTAPRFSGRLDLPSTPLAALVPGAPAVTLGAALTFSGDPRRLEVHGRLATPPSLAGTLDLDATLGYAADVLQIEQFTLATAAHTQLQLSGAVALHDTPSPDLILRWTDLRWPLTGTAAFPLGDGQLHVAGTATDLTGTLSSTLLGGALEGDIQLRAGATPRVQGTLDWSALAFSFGGHPVTLPRGSLRASGTTTDTYAIQFDTRASFDGLPATLALRATGRADGVALEHIRLGALGGHIGGSADIDWQARPHWQADLQARGIDPGTIWPEWPGALQFRLQGEGDATGPQPGLKAHISALGGKLHAQKLSGGGALILAGGHWTIRALALDLGKNRVRIDGGLAGKDGLHWRVSIPDAATLADGAHGKLSTSGAVRAGDGALQVRAGANAAGFRLGHLALGKLSLDTAFDTAFTGPARLTLKAADVSYADISVPSASLSVSGPAKAQQVQAELESNLGTLHLEGVGHLRDGGMQLELTRADLDAADAGDWHLAEPAHLTLGGQQQTLAQSCWQADTGRICARAQHARNDWDAKISLAQVALTPLGRLLPGALALSGALSGTLDASTRHGRIQAEADLTSAGGKVLHRSGDQTLTLLDFTGARLQASLADHKLGGKLDLALADGGFVDARLRTHLDGPVQDRPLEASLRARLDDLGLLPLLVPDLGSLSGHLAADLKFGGTLAAPQLNGSASLEQGDASLPRLGIHLQQVSARCTGTGSGLHVELRAGSGGGSLALTADADRDGNGWRTDGKLTGQAFKAVDIPEATIYLTPDLEFSAAGHHLDVHGSLDVPKARLAPRDLSGTVQVSDDQIIVGSNAPKQPRWQITADVRTQLGDAVQFDGFGLSGLVQGGVRLREQPGRLTTGSGELTIADGKYKAYGQQLDIARGRLLFSGGPVTEPGLDIRATRTSGEVIAGVDIRGTLRSPVLSVFSDPPMPQSQAMSYLLLGHGIDQTSSAEQGTLNTAAVAVGGELLAQQLNRRLGFGEVSVENGDTPGQTSLFLGKYLSPRLYIGYGVGLFQQLSLFKVRYELSKKWTIQAESGTKSSADLLYTIEH